ncbi:unnamed protein product [Linum tenue]|uniref:Transmembrane protein n=1 Tax=Linum tenue TaxID=586396 RepID=A0AAV0MCB0_9ROSI|nr:unnamed protein product [Linum tenue]
MSSSGRGTMPDIGRRSNADVGRRSNAGVGPRRLVQTAASTFSLPFLLLLSVCVGLGLGNKEDYDDGERRADAKIGHDDDDSTKGKGRR